MTGLDTGWPTGQLSGTWHVNREGTHGHGGGAQRVVSGRWLPAPERCQKRLSEPRIHETVGDGIATRRRIGHRLAQADAAAAQDPVHRRRIEQASRYDNINRCPAHEELYNDNEQHKDDPALAGERLGSVAASKAEGQRAVGLVVPTVGTQRPGSEVGGVGGSLSLVTGIASQSRCLCWGREDIGSALI